MSIPGVNSLTQDIEAPFILLGICLVILTLNRRMARQSKLYLLTSRIVFGWILLIFMVMLCVLLYQDRAVLLAVWEQGPLLYSFVYSLGVILTAFLVVGLGYWRLRPEQRK